MEFSLVRRSSNFNFVVKLERKEGVGTSFSILWVSFFQKVEESYTHKGRGRKSGMVEEWEK